MSWPAAIEPVILEADRPKNLRLKTKSEILPSFLLSPACRQAGKKARGQDDEQPVPIHFNFADLKLGDNRVHYA